jgi:hypothetical protein
VNHDSLADSQTSENALHSVGTEQALDKGRVAGARNASGVERICIGVALLIGVLAAFNSAWILGPDGISYLDVGEFWVKGDIANAVNGYWNPLYPLLLGMASKVVGRALYEPLAAHAVNFAIYGLNLFLFSRLLKAMRRIQFGDEDSDPESEFQSDRLFTLLAYVLFFWCHVSLIDLASVSPDILVNSAVIGSAIFLVQLVESENSVSSAAGLGLALGLGYLTKAVMFVAAPFFIVAAVLCATRRRNGFRNAVVATIVFLMVSAPYIFLLSRQRGHLTYSESGKLAYAWMVNRTREYFHWRGVEPGTGTPVHPTRELLREPEVFEFGDRPGTYPPWFDPSYWHDGLKVRVDIKKQLREILRDQRVYFSVLFEQPASVVLLIVFAAGFSAISLRGESRFRRTWPLLIPALAGFCIYLPVFVLPRHLSAFVLLFYLVALWNTWPAAKQRLPSLAAKAIAACAVIPILYALADTASNVHLLNRSDALVQKRVAVALKDFGVQPGDRIAILGRGCEADFARMTRVKIVAEAYRGVSDIPDWARTPEAEARTIEALKPLHVKAIIRDIPANFESTLPWKAVANTKYSILFPDR